ncbi:MAG: ferrous iron transport protein B [Peptococcaceae bacterium]|jgi:ferrous iron transport protein B|nr:ferrous iron transport protein B [Peptococcaceae bacterium]
MSIRIALVGNPNCGKTTMFNALTGSSQYVGNWPGVTVEKKAGKLKKHSGVEVVDLPGIYSLSPYTLEEVVSRNYLIDEKPDAVINIVDSTNLERNLYLTTQVLEMGIPTVVALNMADLLEKQGIKINLTELENALGCPVVETSALKEKGCFDAVEKALQISRQAQRPKPLDIFSVGTDQVLAEISHIIRDKVEKDFLPWYAAKVFERDEEAYKKIGFSSLEAEQVEKIIAAYEEKMEDDSESIITNERYAFIAGVMSQCFRTKKEKHGLSTSDKIDKIVTNRFLALPIFAVVMFAVYYLSITTVGSMMTDWVNDVLFGEIIPPTVEGWLESINAAPWLSSLILDGIIGGIGAVLGFLPQMLTLFFCLAILEDCGYMARIAFIMDRIFRRFGLSGKSFIPMLIGTGCGVPGIMASRTIENERDRRITIITTTFIPCGAKLPIIALIAGALFSGAPWVGPAAYFIGMAAIVVSGVILKKFRSFAGDVAPFVMELPPYHVPGLKGVLLHMWDRGKAFVRKAGTVIFLACGLIWFLQTFNWSLEMVETERSMLADIGNVLAPLFRPLGWGHWQAAVAAVSGLIAKENVVSTFGILYGFAEVAEDGAEIWPLLAADFTKISAFSFLVFNLLCAPCFAAIGAIRREMASAKWTWFAIGYQTGLAYAVSFAIYQLGLFFTGGGLTFFTVLALLIVAAFLWLLFRPYKEAPHRAILGRDALEA